MQDAADEKNPEAADVDKVDAALCSPFFWGYITMTDILAVLFLALSAWVDSCPCHQDVIGEGAFSTRERRSYWKRWLPGRSNFDEITL